MRRSLLLSTLIAVGVSLALPACSDDKTTTSPSGPAPAATDTPTGDPPPPDPGSTSGNPGPTPEPPWVWVAPKVATTSAGCGTARADAVKVEYTTPGGRTFHVWGPTGYDPAKTYPVVIMWHGWQSDGPGFESWFTMENHTNNEAFVVYPSAKNGLWDTQGESDLVFFDEMVKQLGETYCINPSRILGFGFSYGARFVNHLGCRRTGYVKAISAGDGAGTGETFHCGRLPVLITHRTKDTNELLAWGKQNVTTWTGLNKCGATSEASQPTLNCVTQKGCSSPGELTFCEDTFDYASMPNDYPTYDPSWDHTVREPYRAYTWQWFKALP